MKENESRKTSAHGKLGKPLHLLVAVSVITVLVIASIGVGNASAAPVGPGGSGSGTTSNNSDSWQNKVDNLRAEIAIAKDFQTQPGNVNGNGNNTACMTALQSKYRNEYVVTLRAAEGVVAAGSNAVIPTTGNSSSNNSSNSTANSGTSTNTNNNNSGNTFGAGNYYASHPEKLLAAYLHRLRALRSKMNGSEDNNANGNSSTGNNSSNYLSNAFCAGLLGTSNGTGSTGTTTGTGTGTGTGAATSTPAPSTGTGAATSTPMPAVTPTATP